MPKKQYTESERKAVGERLKAAKLAKQAEREAEAEIKEVLHSDTTGAPVDQPVAPETKASDSDYADLQRQVLEMKSQLERIANNVTPEVPQAPQMSMNNRGSLIGTFEKYYVDPSFYPDPTARLAQEPKLQRFAFGTNYDLVWDVSTTSYETKDGISTKEPRFNLELRRILIDEETGEPTQTRYTVCKMMFHEDPQAAIIVARNNGIEIDENNQRGFLDEMRYLRMRDWLLEAFYPPKPSQEKVNSRDAVIGGKLVQVFEINSETSESMPFDQLSKKKMF